jgi:hypothetical protein
MAVLVALASRVYQVPEIHELIGFVYWVVKGDFLS